MNLDLLRGLLGLTAIESISQLTSAFVEVLNAFFSPARFAYSAGDDAKSADGILLQTQGRLWGRVSIIDGSLNFEQHEQLLVAVQTLQVIIERNNFKQQLGNDQDRLNVEIDENSRQLRQSNKELLEANERLKAEILRHQNTVEELQRNEEIFQKFMELSPIYVFFKDEQLRSLRLSKNFEQMIGRPVQELIGKAMDEIFPIDLALPMIETDQRIMLEGKPNAVDETLNGRTYTTIKFPISLSGDKKYLAGFTIDTTERTRAEAALRESESMLARSQQIAHVGSWVLDLQANSLSWSEEVYRIFGLDPALFKPSYSTFLEIVHPEDRAAVDAAYASSVSDSNSVYEIEHRIIRQDNGEIRHIQEKCCHERNEAGEIIRSVGMTQDITERRQAEDVYAFMLQCGLPSSGEDFFSSLARYLAKSLNMGYVCIDILEGDGLTARTVAIYNDGIFESNVRYALKDTPCGEVVEKKTCSYLREVQKKFPNDQALADLSAESYFGATLWDSKGKPIGLIAIIGRQPINEPKRPEFILQLVAPLAAAELERQIAGEALRKNEEHLQHLLRNLQIGVVVHAPDTSILFANNAASKLLGLSVDQMMGKTAIDPAWGFIDENGNRLAPEQYPVTRTIASGKAIENFVLGINRPVFNDLVWVLIKAFPEFDDRMQLTQVVVAFADITDRKRTEEELRKSRATLSSVLDTIPQSVFWKDRDGVYLGCNCKFAVAVGLAETSQVIGKTDYDMPWPREEADAYRADDKEVLNNDSPKLHIVEPLQQSDGSRIWIDTTKIPLKNEDGVPYAVLGVYEDITERKLAEVELLKAKAVAEENETRFQALHNASFGGISIHDKGKILDCNQGLSVITGYSVEELIGMNGLLLISEKTRDLVLANIMAGYEKPYEAIGLRKNGEEFPMRLEAREIPYRGKQVRVVEFRDITEQKKADAILAAEKERLAVTLRSIGDGVITTDIYGNVLLMNRVAEELTGWLQKEAYGQPLAKVFNIINEVSRMPCESPVEKVLTTGGIVELANHTVLIARDGTERYIADSGAPIKDVNSVTIGVVLVFRDMTEKQRFLDSLQRTDKLEAIGVLAGGIAHDFNNLLSGVFGYIELARMAKETEVIESYLDQAMVVFGRAKNLTQQLLTFAKGGAPLRKTGDLGPVIKESTLFSLSGSNVTCEFKIPDDLWTADFDRGQIGQVVDNLVINAQQAMPIGGKLLINAQNVVFKTDEHPLLKEGKYVRFSITDTGTGMHPDLLKRIFDPFFTTKQKGNGLGLATCYAIVQKHAGMIDVESVPGKGSTFHVFLPASLKGTAGHETVSTIVHRGQGRILIMDDEEFVRNIISRLLQSMGYDVIASKDGEEALKRLAEAKVNGPEIDAAIFDLTVPGGMGGKDAIMLLRKSFPGLPVFVSSGYSEDPVMAQPQNFGFNDSLRKPYRKEELAAMLNRHLVKSSPG